MFARRTPLASWGRLRELMWPRSGWQRASRYLGHRLKRLPGTPHYIAAGFASGAAISFTPFVGFHFVLSALLSWILRGSIVAAAVGTVVGNPWTFPFIWVWTYKLGNWLRGDPTRASDLPKAELGVTYMLQHPEAGSLLERIFLPMSIGGILTALVVWFAVYLPLRKGIDAYRQHRRGLLARARRASPLLHRREDQSAVRAAEEA
jgi:uncharacterized protein